MGGQASWLLPAALLALVGRPVGAPAARRAPTARGRRCSLWGGWLIVTAIVFSFGQGVIHTYYTVALAPAIAALVAIGGALLWRAPRRPAARALAALAVAGTAAWAYVLLDRTPSWEPWLRAVIVIAAARWRCSACSPRPRSALGPARVIAAALVLGAVACLAGPVAYAAQTIATAHTGSVPSAGPAVAQASAAALRRRRGIGWRRAGGFGGGPRAVAAVAGRRVGTARRARRSQPRSPAAPAAPGSASGLADRGPGGRRAARRRRRRERA